MPNNVWGKVSSSSLFQEKEQRSSHIEELINDKDVDIEEIVSEIKKRKESKPMIKSKIVWTQVVGFISLVLANFNIEMDEETLKMVVTSLAGLYTAATIILRKYFTRKPLL